LLIGVYNFTIFIFDTSSNSVNDTVFVTVTDETNPVIDNPSNVLYAFGITGNLINWTATDNYPDTYVIYQNGSQVDSGSWTSGVKISYNIDSLTQGYYNYTIVMTDQFGNSILDTVIVAVVDGTSLSISSPSDIQSSEGSTGNSIDWAGVDDFPDGYTIYQNGSIVDSGNWTSGVTISYNIDGLSKGPYNFTIVIYDITSNSVQDTVIIMVVDTTTPAFSILPPDLQYSEGEISNALLWNSTDLYPATYIIYKDGLQVDSGSWTNVDNITISVDGLLKGTYNYTIVVTDESGNNAIDTILLTVVDTTIPVLTDNPSDLQNVEDSVGNTLNWTATDSYSGNSVVDTVFVTVIDLTSPNLSSPLDIQYEEATVGNKIVWNSVDNYPNNLTIYRNGSTKFTGSWTSGDIEYIIDDLSIGIYNFTIIVVDNSGNSANDTVFVTVVDSLNPTVNTPSDVTFTEGTTGNNIFWTGSDLHPDQHIIYLNGTEVISSVWASNVPIGYDIDGLTKGIYNLTISLLDTSNNFVSDTVIITVIDLSPPILNAPGDIQYSEDSTGNSITWIGLENYPDTYIIYRNGSQINAGSWISAVDIIYNIDGLPTSYYNFTIILFDKSNISVTDAVFVTVLDTTSPIFVVTAPNVQYIEGITGNYLVWNTTDRYPSNYIIYLDDIQFESGSWSNSEEITINIDNLSWGIYNYTIVVIDVSGNQAIVTTIVTIVDTLLPIFEYNTSDIQYEEGTTGNILIWNTTDAYPDNYIVYQNGSQLKFSSWSNSAEISITINGLSKGVYNYTIIVSDLSGNQVVDEVIVTVIDILAPNIIDTPTLTEYSEESFGNTLDWIVVDNHPNTYVIYQNDSIIESSFWINNVTITRNIDGLTKGSYNFTIVVFDDSGNIATFASIITIIDNTIPSIIVDLVNRSYIEGTSGNEISWIVSDNYPQNFTILRDDVLLFTDTWISNNQVTYNIDGLAKGLYNYSVIISDVSGNSVVLQVIINVEDKVNPVISSSPLNQTIIEGSTNNVVSWELNDLYPGNFTVYQNGILLYSKSWSNTINIFIRWLRIWALCICHIF
jgi:hypothetical protein